MTSEKKLWVALIAVAIIALAGLFTPAASKLQQDVTNYGGVTNYDELDATALKIGGTNGSRVGPIIVGTCSLATYANYTLAASTTVAMDCPVTGVVSGDNVQLEFATSTAVFGGWTIVGASASTTAGHIEVRVLNQTGASALIPNSIASTTMYQVFHPLTSVPGL